MKKKVIILYNKVWDYRIEMFNLINRDFDLTVAYTDKKFIDSSFDFKTLYTPGRKIGPFYIHFRNLHKIVKNYDVVIGLYDVRILSIMALSLLRRRYYKLIFWGIGVTASYKNRFDSKQTWDRIRYFFGRRADALIFYSDYPLQKYIDHGLRREKLFVAHNTVSVEYIDDYEEDKKKDFLFIGTLYKQKGVNELIDAYVTFIKRTTGAPKLHIIGGGPYEDELRQFLINNNLHDHIIIHGPIYDKKALKNYFRKAIVCISPNQAGLSVLTSMGHGVPYLTSSDSLTGGERLNIENGVNGILYNAGKDELVKQMIWMNNNRDKMLEMGKKAYDHYTSCRRPEHMAASIVQAIKYSLKESFVS